MKIKIYGRPSCPLCEMTKNICTQNEKRYEYIDLNDQIVEELASKFVLGRSLPIIIVDDGAGDFYLESPTKLTEYFNQKQAQNMLTEIDISL